MPFARRRHSKLHMSPRLHVWVFVLLAQVWVLIREVLESVLEEIFILHFKRGQESSSYFGGDDKHCRWTEEPAEPPERSHDLLPELIFPMFNTRDGRLWNVCIEFRDDSDFPHAWVEDVEIISRNFAATSGGAGP